jgi:hypothetical protein
MVIEKNIPIPARKSSRISKLIQAMELGDSFLCETLSDSDNARICAANHGMKVTSRKTSDGWRVWRIE